MGKVCGRLLSAKERSTTGVRFSFEKRKIKTAKLTVFLLAFMYFPSPTLGTQPTVLHSDSKRNNDVRFIGEDKTNKQ